MALKVPLFLAPSPCKRAKSKFIGPRNISRIFEGLEVREVLVPSALLRFGKMQKFVFVREPAFADPDNVSSTSAAYDFHEILRGPVSLFVFRKHHPDQSIHAQTIIPFVFS